MRVSARCSRTAAAQAIYPTLVIVLVSLEQSPLERGITAAPRPSLDTNSSSLPRYSRTTAMSEGGSGFFSTMKKEP